MGWSANCGVVRVGANVTGGAAGEALTGNTASITDVNVCVTADTLFAVDLRDAFSAAAAGDYFGINTERLGAHACDTVTTVYYAAILLEYS